MNSRELLSWVADHFVMLALLLVFVAADPAHGANWRVNPSGAKAAEAPAELEHWGKLVGQWSTTEESLNQDGTGWQPTRGADWSFYWAYDGWGIQDYYVSPPSSVAMDDESQRQRGINLRIYNPVEKKWILTWLTTASSAPQSFTAESTDERIVMSNLAPDAKGFYHRITFFDMTHDRFEWKLEWSKDRSQWLEVYRIHAKRKE